jgi:TolB-like protein
MVVTPSGTVSAWTEDQRAEFLRYVNGLIALPAFSVSRRSCQLLRYLIDRKLAGDAESLNEYAIGLDVFEKPQSFDPRSEATVRVQVSRLRKMLAEYYTGQGANDPWRIVIPPRGYVASIEACSAVPVPQAVETRKRFGWWIVAAAAVLSIATLLLVRFARRPQINSVVVLPFANLTGDPHQDYITDGITEQLTDSLAHISSLRVVARTSAFQFRGKAGDIREIGRRLNADAVVEGSLASRNGGIRLTVQVNRSSDGYHVFSQTFDGETKDLGRLEAQMVKPVLVALHHETPLPERRAPNPEAYDLFFKARALRGQGTKAAFEQAVAYLNQAIAIDPKYGDAYAALAGVYVLGALGQGLPPLESAARAKAAAQNALLLDPSNGDAWAAEGYADAMIFLNWKAGEEELKHAVELIPQSAKPHNWLGSVLTARGEFPGAIAELKIAENLDPLPVAPGATVGLAYYMARQYDDALRKFSLLSEMHPEAVVLQPFIGSVWEAKGDYEKAMSEYNSAMLKIPAEVKPRMAHLLAVTGKRAEALALLSKLESPPPDSTPPNAFDLGVIYGALGEREKAFAWLDHAYDQRIVWFLKVHPMLDPLRSDPRYAALVRKAGLSEN